MPDQLKIFLSHKLRSRDAAQKIAAALAAFAGDRVLVFCSANYPPGINWEQEIRSALDQSSWLILLYDIPEDNQDWCMFETGYFRARMGNDSEAKRIVCLHDPDNQIPNHVPNPITMFNPVPATKDAVGTLFRSIYVDPPWAIKPDLDAELLTTMITRVVNAVRNRPVPQWTITISPRFIVNIRREASEELRVGRIPADSLFEGEAGWEPVFAKTVSTLSWPWQDLVTGLSDTEAWSYQLARMMWEALKFKRVEYPSIALAVRTAGGKGLGIYRFTLTRFEEGAGDCHRFTFIAVPIITPFDASDNSDETMLYHVFNIAWSYRSRIIQKHLTRLSALSNEDRPREMAQAVRELKDDLRALAADTQVRGLDQQNNPFPAFAENDRAEAQRLGKQLWPVLKKKLYGLVEEENPHVPGLMEILREVVPINRFFYRAALTGLLSHSDGQDGTAGV